VTEHLVVGGSRASGPDTRAAGTPSRWGELRALVRFVLQRTFVIPVSEGRLADRGWTPGLRAVVWMSLLWFLLLTMLSVAAPVLRSVLPLAQQAGGATFPLAILPVLITAVSGTLALVATAALRLRWWAQVIAFFVLAGILVWAPLSIGSLVGLAATVLVLLGYLVLILVRRRRPFQAWEFVVLLVAIGTVASSNLVLTATSWDGPVDLRLTYFLTWYLPLFGLATPIAILAGVAMAEITIATVTWAVSAVVRAARARASARSGAAARGRWARRLASWVGLVAITGTLVVREILDFADADNLGLTLRGVGMFLLVLVFVVPVLWRAERRSLLRPDADDVVVAWPGASVPVGLLVALPFLYGVLVQLLGALGLSPVVAVLAGLGGSYQSVVLLVLGALGLYGLAWRRAVAGWGPVAVAYAAIAAVLLLSSVASWFDIDASLAGLRTGGWCAAVITLVVLVVRRRLEAERAVALAVVLVVAGLFGFRQMIYEPLTYLVAAVGVSLGLVAGLVWRLLTDNGWTRTGSPGFPRASRVMLALANLLFGALAVAVVALGGGHLTLDLEQFEGLGDQLVGNGLWAGVSVAALVLAWRGPRVASS